MLVRGSPLPVYIAGVGMTAFGRHADRDLRTLALEAAEKAVSDSGLSFDRIERIYFANAAAGTVCHQDMIRGQVAFRGHALARRPIFNVENACASGGSAFQLAVEAVGSGVVEVALVVGCEKLNHSDKMRAFKALRGSTDVGEIGELVPGQVSQSSLLMQYYASVARQYIDRYGASSEDFARVAVKNRSHAALNPIAHLRKLQTTQEVLRGRIIEPPLTLAMCSPITDGAAAVVVCADRSAGSCGRDRVKVWACAMASGTKGSPVSDAAALAFEAAAVEPRDIDLFELHDAAAPAELIQYHEIGLCREGEGFLLVRNGTTDLEGASPVNVSGGLLSRGHPLGATGCAQIVELVTQLRGHAGVRQVNDARLAMSLNGGGWLDGAYALAVATVLGVE